MVMEEIVFVILYAAAFKFQNVITYLTMAVPHLLLLPLLIPILGLVVVVIYFSHHTLEVFYISQTRASDLFKELHNIYEDWDTEMEQTINEVRTKWFVLCLDTWRIHYGDLYEGDKNILMREVCLFSHPNSLLFS